MSRVENVLFGFLIGLGPVMWLLDVIFERLI